MNVLERGRVGVAAATSAAGALLLATVLGCGGGGAAREAGPSGPEGRVLAVLTLAPPNPELQVGGSIQI
ncbi:MAG: hypothetical protein M3373_14700, partial [Gemmatimonadota bacterium]|nr:hypothetical protein [Gemmatimonadota bacterium]